MNSNFDNCILKNAIYKNGNPHNEHEISDLMYLRAVSYTHLRAHET